MQGAKPLLTDTVAVSERAAPTASKSKGEEKKEEATTRHSVLAPLSWAVFVVSLILSMGVLARHGGGLTPDFQNVQEEEIAVYRTALLMVVPGVLIECAHALSSSWSGASIQYSLVLLEFLVKFGVYLAMWQCKGLIVHVNNRSPEPRAVYTLRWLEWAVAVPALSAVSLSVFGADSSRVSYRRMAPGVANCFAFVLTSWTHQITPDGFSGNALLIISFVSFAMYLVEQILIIAEFMPVARFWRFKTIVMLVKNIIYCSYGAVMICDSFGVMSSLHVQTFYTYADVVLKSLQAGVLAMIKNWDAEATRAELNQQVATGQEDTNRMIGKASAPIVCLTKEGMVMAWNAKIAQQTRISEVFAIGKPLSALLVPESLSTLASALDALASKQHSSAIELTFKSQEVPESTAAHMTMSFISQFGQNPFAIVGIGQDMTELIASQELQERRMRFTAIVSHELKSPLHGIIGLSQSMSAEASRDETDRKQLSMIYGCGQRLLDLVSNIMDEASMKNPSSLKKQAESVNFLDIVDEVISLSRAAVDKSGRPLLKPGVQLVNHMTMERIPLVSGDPHKCMQLIYNLVTNSCKFTKSGSIALSANFSPGRIEINVADTGCGISPEALSRIFEAYSQESGAKSGSFQGIGLGLSVAKGIAEMHGGRISVKSELGIGSSFTVTLPCEKQEGTRRWDAKPEETQRAEVPEKALPRHSVQSIGASAPRSTPAVIKVPSGEPRNLQGVLRQLEWASEDFGPTPKPVILSVDDDEVNHIVLEKQLSEKYHLEKAMDGHEALEYLKSDKPRPCIMLLDLMMPGMNGLELLKIIRTEMNLSHLVLPVVMLSARTPYEDTCIKSMEAGTTDFLLKPFSSKVLQEKMRIHMETRKDGLAIYQKMLTCQQGAGATDGAGADLEAAKEEVARLQEEVARVRDEAEERAKKLREQVKEEVLTDVRTAQERGQTQSARQEELAAARQEVLRLKGEVARVGEETEGKIRKMRQQIQDEAAEQLELREREVGRREEDFRRAATQGSAADSLELEQKVERVVAELEVQRDVARKLQGELDESQHQLAILQAAQSCSLASLGASTIMMPQSTDGRTPASRASGSSSREVLFLRRELKSTQAELSEVILQMGENSNRVIMEQIRADACQREVAFLKAELQLGEGHGELAMGS